jgi:hypothetical protein
MAGDYGLLCPGEEIKIFYECTNQINGDLTLEEPFALLAPLVDPVWGTLFFALTNCVKFFIVAETAMALIRQTAGVATRINRTMTPAKYMLVRPYITINIVASDNRLKQK